MNMRQFLISVKENKKWNKYTSEELFEDAMEYYKETGEKIFPTEDYELMSHISKKYSDKYNFKDLPFEVALLSRTKHTEYEKLVTLQKLIETPKEEVPEDPRYWEDYFVFNILLEDEDKKDLTVLDVLLKKECVDLLSSDLFDYEKISRKYRFVDKDDEFFRFRIGHAEEINNIKSRKEVKQKVKTKKIDNKFEQN